MTTGEFDAKTFWAQFGQPAAQQNGAAADAAPEMPAPARRLVLTPASQIEPEPVIWAWEDDDGYGRIPAGSFGLFAGREGTGKSSNLIWMAARITRGELAGAFSGRPLPVIYVASEDSWKYTIAPRLLAAGADLKLIYRAEVVTMEGDTVSISLPLDIKLLEDAIRENEVALVVIDPLMSTISERLDTHVNREVRQAIEPVVRMADRTGAIVAGIAHFNKSSGTDPSSLVTGSGAFKDVARFIFAFAKDEETGELVITQTKNSLGRSDLPSLRYRIIEAIVPTAKGEARVGRFVLDGVSERSVAEILGTHDGESPATKLREAEEFLEKTLAEGPRPTKDVEDEAVNGYGIKKMTLERARKKLHIVSGKVGSAGWYVALREHEGDLDELKKNPPSPRPAKTVKSLKSSSKAEVEGHDGVDRKENHHE